MKAVIVSGYFNPLHKGHLEYLNHAKAIADKLIVIVNNDHQRELKGSKEFQDEEERVIIISNLKAVDEVVLSVDQDRTVCETIRQISETIGKPTKKLEGHSKGSMRKPEENLGES